MACSHSHLLFYPFTSLKDKLTLHYTKFPENPTNFAAQKLTPRFNSSFSTTQITGNAEVIQEPKERQKFRWVVINPEKVTESQKLAISRLPKKMEKRCTAVMKQIICFSPEKGNLSDLLGAWVKIMKPRRADWLAILKELCFMDHPLFFEV